MFISMYDNINAVSAEAANFLRICNTYSIKISVNVVPNNRSETETSCPKTRSCGTLKNKNCDDKLRNSIYPQGLFSLLLHVEGLTGLLGAYEPPAPITFSHVNVSFFLFDKSR